MTAGSFQVGRHHFGAHLARADLRLPAKRFARRGGVAQQRFHLGGTEISRVDANDRVPDSQLSFDGPAD